MDRNKGILATSGIARFCAMIALSISLCSPAALAADAVSPAPAPVPPSTGTEAKPADANATSAQPSDAAPINAPKVLLKPGQSLSVGTDTEDLIPTDDLDVARRQVAAYPDSPEASFILAVALTRTSRVEEAIREVQRARKLADKQGGPGYFDHMISTYEEMLKNYPDDNRVRYGLAWAYYMKAYLVSEHARKASQPKTPGAKPSSLSTWMEAAVSGQAPKEPPHIKGALERADESAVPVIKKYYEASLSNLDDLLARKPDDIWAKVYRAFLNAEYTGDVDPAMQAWQACLKQAPDNPAPYFFLGEAYLRKGNLKESLNNISRAIALRAVGK